MQLKRRDSLKCLLRDFDDCWILCHCCEMLYPQASLDLRHPCVQASGAIELTYGQTRGKVCNLGFLNGWQGRASLHPLALAQSCVAKHQPPDLRLRQLIDWPHQSIDSLSFAFLFVEQDMKIEVLTSARIVDDDLILKFDTRVIIPSGDRLRNVRIQAPDSCDSSGAASVLRWETRGLHKRSLSYRVPC